MDEQATDKQASTIVPARKPWRQAWQEWWHSDRKWHHLPTLCKAFFDSLARMKVLVIWTLLVLGITLHIYWSIFGGCDLGNSETAVTFLFLVPILLISAVALWLIGIVLVLLGKGLFHLIEKRRKAKKEIQYWTDLNPPDTSPGQNPQSKESQRE